MQVMGSSSKRQVGLVYGENIFFYIYSVGHDGFQKIKYLMGLFQIRTYLRNTVPLTRVLAKKSYIKFQCWEKSVLNLFWQQLLFS